MFKGFGVQKLAMTLNLTAESNHSEYIGRFWNFNRIEFYKGKSADILLLYLLLDYIYGPITFFQFMESLFYVRTGK